MKKRDDPKVLPAKLSAPNIEAFYKRNRLFNSIDHIKEHKIIWLSSPGGAGKTTLASSFLQSNNIPSIWYQIDEGDNDVASFFYYLEIAASHVLNNKRIKFPKLSADVLMSLDKFSTRFFSELYPHINKPFAIVFDNLHEIADSSAVYLALQAAINQLPKHIILILISRHTLPEMCFNESTLNLISKIGWDEIKLSPEETSEFIEFSGYHGINHIDLYQQCTGWIAGLILLLEGAVSGNNEAVSYDNTQTLFDYFISEIFSKRSEEERGFLLQTALFPYFSEDMAVELTGYQQAGHLLSDLVKQHHFTELRDKSSLTYQYHPLFLGFLRQQHTKLWSEDVLHSKQHLAAKLLERSGIPEHALMLYINSKNYLPAIELLLRHAKDYVASGRFSSLFSLLALLPSDIINSEPWLLYWRGICQLTKPDVARIDLTQAYHGFTERNDTTGIYLTLAANINSYNIEWSDFRPTDKWISEFQKIYSTNPEFPSKEVEAQAVFSILTVLLNRRLNGETTDRWAIHAENLLKLGLDIGLRGTFGISLILYHCSMGNTERAKDIASFLRDTLHAHQDPSVTSVLHVGICYYECMCSDTKTALQRLNHAMSDIEKFGVRIWEIQTLGECIYANLTVGDWQSAIVYLNKMKELLPHAGLIHSTFYNNLASIIAFHQNELNTANEYAITAINSVRETGPSYGETDCFLAQAHIAWSRNDKDTAYQALSALEFKEKDSGSKWCAFCARITQARFAIDEHKEDAFELLNSALVLSKDMGGRNLPWITHDVLRDLFSTALDHGLEIEHVKQLIARYRLQPGNNKYLSDNWPYPIKIYTLGRFDVRSKNDSILNGVRPKPLLLLKTLLALGGREVSEEMLTDILWPDADGDAGRRTFNVTLRRLRQILGDEKSLHLVNAKLSVNNQYCWIDAWHLEQILTEIKNHIDTSTITPGVIQYQLERLFHYYTGQFLQGNSEHKWIILQQERIHSRVTSILREAGNFFESSAFPELAIDLYSKSIEIIPLSEYFYQRLIQLHLENEQTESAKGVYQKCVDNFSRLLNIAPSPATTSLFK